MAINARKKKKEKREREREKKERKQRNIFIRVNRSSIDFHSMIENISSIRLLCFRKRKKKEKKKKRHIKADK